MYSCNISTFYFYIIYHTLKLLLELIFFQIQCGMCFLVIFLFAHLLITYHGNSNIEMVLCHLKPTELEFRIPYNFAYCVEEPKQMTNENETTWKANGKCENIYHFYRKIEQFCLEGIFMVPMNQIQRFVFTTYANWVFEDMARRKELRLTYAKFAQMHSDGHSPYAICCIIVKYTADVFVWPPQNMPLFATQISCQFHTHIPLFMCFFLHRFVFYHHLLAMPLSQICGQAVCQQRDRLSKYREWETGTVAVCAMEFAVANLADTKLCEKKKTTTTMQILVRNEWTKRSLISNNSQIIFNRMNKVKFVCGNLKQSK